MIIGGRQAINRRQGLRMESVNGPAVGHAEYCTVQDSLIGNRDQARNAGAATLVPLTEISLSLGNDRDCSAARCAPSDEGKIRRNSHAIIWK